MTNTDFTSKSLHEYVDSYLKSYYEAGDKDASADADMQIQDVKTGDAPADETDGAFKDRKKIMEFIYANIDSLKSKDGVKDLIEYIKQIIADAKDGE